MIGSMKPSGLGKTSKETKVGVPKPRALRETRLLVA